MRYLKKLAFVLFLVLSFDVHSTVVADQSGTCGSHLVWNINPYGLMTISGSGAMTEYESTKTRLPGTGRLYMVLRLPCRGSLTKVANNNVMLAPGRAHANPLVLSPTLLL